MGTFVQAGLEEIPKWLNGPEMRAYVEALRAAFDVELEDLRFAVKQRFAGICEDEALDNVGGGYVIERFEGEGFVPYRARVLAAWETWGKAGTVPAIVDSLNAYGIPDVQIFESSGDW